MSTVQRGRRSGTASFPSRDIGPYPTLYVIDADGSRQTRISDAFGQIANWSPDGRYIVFEGRRGLSIMQADGSGLTTLPTGVSPSGFPDWIRG